MKFTQTQAIELLKSIGVADAALVDEAGDSTYDKSQALTAIDASRKEVLKPLIVEDVREEIVTQIAGKQGGILEGLLTANFGISRKEFEGLSDKEKVSKAIEHYKSTLEKDKQETSNRIDEILAASKEREEALVSKYEGELTKAQQRYIDRDIKEFIANKLNEAPLPEGANRLLIANDLLTNLRDRYDLRYNEDAKHVELFVKGKPDMPAMNAAKNARIEILDEAKEYLEPRSLWMTDMRSVNAVNAMKGKDTQPAPQKTAAPVNNNNFGGGKAFVEEMKQFLETAK